MADIIYEEELQLLRKKIFITGYRGGMAHLASCYSCLEIVYALYMMDVMKYDRSNPEWKDRDRFILSKGHAGLALYCVLNRAGLLPDSQFESYLREGAVIGGEPCMRDSRWVEATTGSLGHGLSMAVGVAMALKMDCSPARVYCMLGDGECEEGTIWEAAMSASAFSLNNLVAILDCNQIQKMDYVEEIIGATLWRDRFESFGWKVTEVDGHDVEAVGSMLIKVRDEDKPTLVIAHTTKGKGVSIMENNTNWHFKLPGKRELKVFMKELDISDWELE